MKRNRLYLLTLVLAVSAAAASARLASRTWNDSLLNEGAVASPPQQTQTAARAPYPFRVSASRLRPQLRGPFHALGDRLSKPGKERLTLTGALSRADGARPEQVQVLLEFPNLLSVAGASGLLASFDERFARGGPAGEALVETLFYDSAEHFFFAQARGAATRFLGPRAETGGPAGPFHDVYEVTEDVPTDGGAARPRTKHYFFNSDTQLLEGVRYEIERDGAAVSVEVRVGGWWEVQGQRVPGSVVRLENGQTVFSLAVSAAALAPRAREGGTPRRPAA